MKYPLLPYNNITGRYITELETQFDTATY